MKVKLFFSKKKTNQIILLTTASMEKLLVTWNVYIWISASWFEKKNLQHLLVGGIETSFEFAYSAVASIVQEANFFSPARRPPSWSCRRPWWGSRRRWRRTPRSCRGKPGRCRSEREKFNGGCCTIAYCKLERKWQTIRVRQRRQSWSV